MIFWAVPSLRSGRALQGFRARSARTAFGALPIATANGKSW